MDLIFHGLVLSVCQQSRNRVLIDSFLFTKRETEAWRTVPSHNVRSVSHLYFEEITTYVHMARHVCHNSFHTLLDGYCHPHFTYEEGTEV